VDNFIKSTTTFKEVDTIVQHAIIGAGHKNRGAGIGEKPGFREYVVDTDRVNLEASMGPKANAKLSEVQNKFRAKRANHRT
jgi:hypothetical protein